MTLRDATVDDLDAIMAIENRSFPTDAWSAETMAAELASPHGRYLVDEHDGAVIGYGGVRALHGSADADIQTIALLAERPATRELHREPDSFMLLAHAEQRGLYRPPHDHGRAWVVYSVQSGALEIGSYVRVPNAGGDRLVRRDTAILRPGEARAYLPGDSED